MFIFYGNKGKDAKQGNCWDDANAVKIGWWRGGLSKKIKIRDGASRPAKIIVLGVFAGCREFSKSYIAVAE